VITAATHGDGDHQLFARSIAVLCTGYRHVHVETSQISLPVVFTWLGAVAANTSLLRHDDRATPAESRMDMWLDNRTSV